MTVYTQPRHGLPRHHRSVLFTDVTRIEAKMKRISPLIALYEPRHKSEEADCFEQIETIRQIGAYIHRKSDAVRLSDMVKILRTIWSRVLPVESCKAFIGRYWPEICDHAERLERRDTIAKEWPISAIRKAEIAFALNPRTAFFSRHSMRVAGDTLANYRRFVDIDGTIWLVRKSNGQRWKFDTESCRLIRHREA